MTDLEITVACAKAMGLQHYVDGNTEELMTERKGCDSYEEYNPLKYDAQNAALDDVLLKHGWFHTYREAFYFVSSNGNIPLFTYETDMTLAANRRRARAECVAKLMEGV